MNRKQTSDHMQNGGASGTKVTGLHTKPNSTPLGDSNGVSGANVAGNDTKNRNKKS